MNSVLEIRKANVINDRNLNLITRESHSQTLDEVLVGYQLKGDGPTYH